MATLSLGPISSSAQIHEQSPPYLPQEILQKIMSYLPCSSLVVSGQVCQDWAISAREVARLRGIDETVWKEICHWPVITMESFIRALHKMEIVVGRIERMECIGFGGRDRSGKETIRELAFFDIEVAEGRDTRGSLQSSRDLDRTNRVCILDGEYSQIEGNDLKWELWETVRGVLFISNYCIKRISSRLPAQTRDEISTIVETKRRKANKAANHQGDIKAFKRAAVFGMCIVGLSVAWKYFF